MFFFVWLHAQRARIDQRDVGHLRHRRGVTVVIDHYVVENAGVCPPGAHLGEIVLQRVQRLAHFLFGRLLDIGDAGFSHVHSST